MQQNESRHRFYILHKINSKWITDLSVKCKIIKLQEDNMRGNLDDLGFGDDFLDTTPNTLAMKKMN